MEIRRGRGRPKTQKLDNFTSVEIGLIVKNCFKEHDLNETLAKFHSENGDLLRNKITKFRNNL